MSYRKTWIEGVRAYVVQEPTPERPIAALVCRASLLPIGVDGWPLKGGWIMFVLVGLRAVGVAAEPVTAGNELELDDLAE